MSKSTDELLSEIRTNIARKNFRPAIATLESMSADPEIGVSVPKTIQTLKHYEVALDSLSKGMVELATAQAGNLSRIADSPLKRELEALKKTIRGIDAATRRIDTFERQLTAMAGELITKEAMNALPKYKDVVALATDLRDFIPRNINSDLLKLQAEVGKQLDGAVTTPDLTSALLNAHKRSVAAQRYEDSFARAEKDPAIRTKMLRDLHGPENLAALAQWKEARDLAIKAQERELAARRRRVEEPHQEARERDAMLSEDFPIKDLAPLLRRSPSTFSDNSSVTASPESPASPGKDLPSSPVSTPSSPVSTPSYGAADLDHEAIAGIKKLSGALIKLISGYDNAEKSKLDKTLTNEIKDKLEAENEIANTILRKHARLEKTSDAAERSKLVASINHDLLPQAKQLAEKRGHFLNGLIEATKTAAATTSRTQTVAPHKKGGPGLLRR